MYELRGYIFVEINHVIENDKVSSWVCHLLIDQSFCWKAGLCGSWFRQASSTRNEPKQDVDCRDMDVMFPSRLQLCHGMEPRHFTMLLMDCPEASVKVGYNREISCLGRKWTTADVCVAGSVDPSRNVPLEALPSLRKILSLGHCWKSNSQYESLRFWL